MTSIIYRHSSLYELAMAALYHKHYWSRLRHVADLLEEDKSVVDVCCGPATIYFRELKDKNIDYLGLDINPNFIRRLSRRGAKGQVVNVANYSAFPEADYVIMLASLYHFLPGPDRIIQAMQRAARRSVVISEPIRNLSSSKSTILRRLGAAFTDPGTGRQPQRFDESMLDELFHKYSSSLVRSFVICGGREKVYVLKGLSSAS